MIASIARLRVPLGFLAGVLMLWLSAPTPGSVQLGSAIAAVGEALRVWAAGHLNKGREVTASGPYRWFAHPLYVGSSVMAAGLAIACASAAGAAVIGIYVFVAITAAIKNEEAFLRFRFGEGYDRYRRDGVVDDRRRFSLAQAMRNREYRAVIGLALAVLLLSLKATYNESFWWSVGARIVRPVD